MFDKEIKLINGSKDTFEFLMSKYPTVSIFKELHHKIDEMQYAYGKMRACLVNGDDFTIVASNYTHYISEDQLLEMYEAYKDYFTENVEIVGYLGREK